MNKVAHYLQEHLNGEVMTSRDVRDYFSTDTSVFQLTPSIVVYPRNENDIRKTARFTWQLAERGRFIPLTARGSGTDQSGAALGEGIMMVFPAHLNRILELDGKTGLVTVEPGINYAKLQQTLNTHNLFLPPYPSSMEYCTIGGSIANNAGGEKSIKYGNTRDFVRSMRVVLANGEVIETRRLSKRELGKKLGSTSFEGEVYRSLDALIEENLDLISTIAKDITKNSAGYALSDVKRKDGSFDLTPLFVGSQGTLGLVAEATIETEEYNPQTSLFVAFFDDMHTAQDVVEDLHGLRGLPSAIEVVDENLLQFVHQYNPNQLKGILEPPFSKLVMLIEFDDNVDRKQKKLAKKAKKILEKHNVQYRFETDPDKKDDLWKIRHSAAAVIAYGEGGAKALPIIEDGIVPRAKFSEYTDGIYKLFEKYGLKAAFWGHAGNANLHMQPFLDLSQVGDRQKVFKIMDDYYKLVMDMGGSTNGEHGDGRLRGPYLKALYGEDVYALFKKVKKIFDPYNTMNPGVKIDVTFEAIKPLLRQEYSLSHLHDHMPRT